MSCCFKSSHKIGRTPRAPVTAFNFTILKGERLLFVHNLLAVLQVFYQAYRDGEGESFESNLARMLFDSGFSAYPGVAQEILKLLPEPPSFSCFGIKKAPIPDFSHTLSKIETQIDSLFGKENHSLLTLNKVKKFEENTILTHRFELRKMPSLMRQISDFTREMTPNLVTVRSGDSSFSLLSLPAFPSFSSQVREPDGELARCIPMDAMHALSLDEISLGDGVQQAAEVMGRSLMVPNLNAFSNKASWIDARSVEQPILALSLLTPRRP